MRLIDADLLIESIQATLNTGRESFPADTIYEAIDEQPTKFNIDKVVEELELEMKKTKDEVEHGKGLLIKEPFTPYIKAIKIVKGGGIE